MLKASSLSNAIYVCLIIFIFSGCLVLVSSHQNLLLQRLNFEEELLNINNSAFRYAQQNPSDFELDKVYQLDIFNQDIDTEIKFKQWGFYNILKSTSIFKKDTVVKVALLGENKEKINQTALYVTNYDKILKFSGNSKIKGVIKVPKGQIEQAFINTKYPNKTQVSSLRQNSRDKLPRLKKFFNLNISNYEIRLLESFKTNSIYNSFKNETIVIEVSDYNQIADIAIKGNIILYSRNSLLIKNTSELKDIILVANKLEFESGFSGSLQIIVKQNIKINEKCSLQYPSSIYAENDIDSVKVHIKKDSKLAGGVIINGKSYSGSLKRELIIDESAEVYGVVYCYGKTQLSGVVNGSLFTDRFFVKTNSAEYENTVINGSVNTRKLPNNFYAPPVFNNSQEEKTYEIIKSL